MLKYAREDTHYLLYIHDCLKRDIAAGCHGNVGETRACLEAALDGGRELCLLRYRKDGQCLFCCCFVLEAFDWL